LVHDTDDATVPVSEAAVIAAAWPGAERMVTTGLGHHRIVHDPTVVRQVVAFLAASHDRPRRAEPRTPQIRREQPVA
jgi:pimeloyl-ACP methyl ester carboxylesterase